MSSHHTIPARLDDGDLYVGVWAGCNWGFLGKERDVCHDVDEGGVISV
jgi:hypothetical protein